MEKTSKQGWNLPGVLRTAAGLKPKEYTGEKDLL